MKCPPHSKDLRKGRHSEPNARYFITFNTKPPSDILNKPATFKALQSTLHNLSRDSIISPIAFILMPDHVHALFRLGTVLELGKAIARLKFELRKASEPSSIYWQSNFQDHKLRNDKELHPILHYIYLNPYRAKLLQLDQTWPYLFIEEKEWDWFQPLLDKDCPYPEWLSD